MARSNNDLFCFFSGFAHQDVYVNDYQENLDLQTILLTCHNTGEHSLFQDDYIQLDGVLFQIIATNGSSFKPEFDENLSHFRKGGNLSTN